MHRKCQQPGRAVKQEDTPVLTAFGDERLRLTRMLRGQARCAATVADLLQDVADSDTSLPTPEHLTEEALDVPVALAR